MKIVNFSQSMPQSKAWVALATSLVLATSIDASNGCDPGAGANSCASSNDIASVRGPRVPSTFAGNPINYSNGNKLHKEIDFISADSAIAIARYYNSSNASHNSVMGHGWQASFSPRLYALGGDSRDIVQGDGRRISFHRSANQVSRFNSRNPANGYIIEDNTHRYWHHPDGKTITFRGPLPVRVTWLSSHGKQQRLNFVYNDDRLERLTIASESADQLKAPTRHPSTQVIRFGYNKAGTRIVQMNLPSGDIIKYRYNQSNLMSVFLNGQAIRHYAYAKPNEPHLLTEIFDGNRNLITQVEYDDAGRAIHSKNWLTGSSVDIQFDKSPNQDNQTTTLVTTAFNERGTFTFSTNSEFYPKRLLTSTLKLCNTCSTLGMDYHYNSAGNLSKVTQNSTVTDSTHNPTLPSDIPGFGTQIRSIIDTHADEDKDIPNSLGLSVSSFGTTRSIEYGINRLSYTQPVSHPRSARDNLIVKSLNHQLHSRITADSDTDCLLVPLVDEVQADELEETRNCETDPLETEQSTPSFPEATFVDISAQNCQSYFDVYFGTRRGFEIESGFAEESVYGTAQSTVSNFPVVDFMQGQSAVAIVSLDLRSDTYQNSDTLERVLVGAAAGMQDRFLTPLRRDGVVSSSLHGITTTIQSEDVAELVFELVIQHEMASEEQRLAMLAARDRIENLTGIRFRIVEIP